ncbi:TRAP transporter large permease [Anianabacter salinae]|uniref:TRAP transporter large permease n=1 Tax=Anianabacter salinae TaxID=2851023 RepID=UPI00225E6F9A|nr:TRAP transporter large permease subunit [Anianabacter salinae]MBV0914270.1 TRAP transporter large permease subunit [Anianabacter salinae]
MDILSITATLGAVLLVLLAGGLWIGVTLMAVGFLAIFAFSPAPAGSLMATTVWDHSWNWALTALPLFVWMGEILFRSRLSEDMFSGLAPWLDRLPGRLLHVNIVGCGVMAAVAGSSAVTCATVGRMSLPELQRRGYAENISIGTLAGSGTLGLLIPPSIMMIVYGISAQQSISRLFIAGIVPGLMIMALFMGYVMLWSLFNRDAIPAADERLPFMEKLRRSRRLIPIVILIATVIGSIYGGYATPTEAATLGVAGALLLAWTTGSLTVSTFIESLMAATRTSCMITAIILGAAFLSVGMAFLGIPMALAAWVAGLGLSPGMLLVLLTLIYIGLGCFLEGASMIVLTTTVALPMVVGAGFDPIWFGIYLILVVEMSQITPPVGFNLFVLQGMSGRDIWKVTKASAPFFCLLVVAVVLCAVFPGIVTFLPNMMLAR